MILVNVFCVETSQAYDFKVDETVPIEKVTEDMISMIAEKEHLSNSKNMEEFLLYQMEEQVIFSPMTTLAENGVTSGSKLVLV